MQETCFELKKKRERAKIGLRALARCLKISHIYLRDMERGFRNIPDPVRAKYVKALERIKKPSAGIAA